MEQKDKVAVVAHSSYKPNTQKAETAQTGVQDWSGLYKTNLKT